MAALAASGLDGVEALVLFAASEGLPDELFLAARGWTAEEWAGAAGRLRARGLLAAGGITDEGSRLRRSVEAMTDLQAERAFAVLDAAGARELVDVLVPVTRAVHASGVIAYPNPMGLPAPVGG